MLTYIAMLVSFSVLAYVIYANRLRKCNFVLTSHQIYTDTSYGMKIPSVLYSAYCKNTGKTVGGHCWGKHYGLSKEDFVKMLNTTRGNLN